MVTLRKVTLVAVLAASVAVLAMAAYLFWNLGQEPALLGAETGNIQLLVGILLASCGLYAIVFALSSYSSTMNFARQADRSIATIRDQLGAAMQDLRALQEQARQALQSRAEPRHNSGHNSEAGAPGPSASQNLETHVDAIARQTSRWNSASLDSQAKLELQHYESAAAYLELIGGSELGAALAALYRHFGELYAPSDKTRQRFYLSRALSLAPPDSSLASEIHYDLACWFADNREFAHALGELTLALQHQSKAIDDRLARDIEEGGQLYQLACTAPFEKALNDLLLNMRIGMG
jgi:hypothetical protein